MKMANVTNDTESDDDIVFPCPIFEDHFRSYFGIAKRRDDIKSSLVLYWSVFEELKKKSRRVTAKGKILDTVSIAEVCDALKETAGTDIILYPGYDLCKTKWKSLRLLRVDYTAREDKVCAMAWACFAGDVRAVTQLLTFNTYVDRQMPNGNTLMMEAVAGRSKLRCECIELLLQAGARINLENDCGHTVLTAAAWIGDMDVLRILTRGRQHDINHRTKHGSTCLMLAVVRQHHNVVRYLVTECGADPLIEDNQWMTPVCWSQVESPGLTGFLCLHLGCIRKLEAFVLRRVEVLRHLAWQSSQDVEDIGVVGNTPKEIALLAVIYQLINVLLMLKPSRHLIISKGVINTISKAEVWGDMIGMYDNDRLDIAFMQILPWFVALGCGMLYQETYILDSFISSGGADRLFSGVVCVLLSGNFAELSAVSQCTELYKAEGSMPTTPHNTAYTIPEACSQAAHISLARLLETFDQTLEVSYEKDSRLSLQSILTPLISFQQGRDWLMNTAFKYKNVLKHCVDSDNVLEDGREDIIAGFLSLMSTTFDHYKLKKNQKYFKDVNMKDLCPEPRMSVREKLNESMAYFEGIKQMAKEKLADEDIQALIEMEEEELMKKNRIPQRNKSRKLRGKAGRKMRRYKEQVAIQLEQYDVKNVTAEKTNQAVDETKRVDTIQIKNEERPLVVRNAEDMYRASVESPKKKSERSKPPKHSPNFAFNAISRDDEWYDGSKRRHHKSRAQEAKDKLARENLQKELQLGYEREGLTRKSGSASEIATHSLLAPAPIDPPPIDVDRLPYSFVVNLNRQHIMPVPTALDLKKTISAMHLTEAEPNLLSQSTNIKTDTLTQISDSSLAFGFFGEEDGSIFQSHAVDASSHSMPYERHTLRTHTGPVTVSNIELPTYHLSRRNKNQDRFESGAAGDQALKVTTKMNWVPRSQRWHSLFEHLIAMPACNRQKIGSIHFSFDDTALIIATGSNGTLVSIGLRDDGMEVAVKRLLKANYCSIKNELENLRIPELEHENIVKYRDYVEDECFGYLALELCECTLEDYVHELKHNSMLGQRACRLVWQILRGLAILHRAKILHMDLKPRNVLVDVRGNVRLADFGLSRRMDENHPYHANLLGGTQCWRPREMLQALSEPYTSKSDVQVAGMVIFYVVSGGEHPYGKTFPDIEKNIITGVPCLGNVNDEILVNLMSWMLHPEVARRKSAEECMTHPFFWQENKRFSFLYKVSQESEFQSNTNSAVRGVLDGMGTYLRIGDWRKQVDPFVMSREMAFGSYSAELSDLLGFMADVENNFGKLESKIQKIIEDPGTYFLNKFPRVFMVVYEIVRESGLRSRRSLTDFFDVHNYIQN